MAVKTHGDILVQRYLKPKLRALPRFVQGQRNITAKPNRKLFFGLGNWCYPRSRASIGIWVLEEWARRNNLAWDLEFSTTCGTTENEDAILVKPMTYNVEQNGSAWLKGVDAFKTPFDRCVVIHHDERRDFGDIELTYGGRVEYLFFLFLSHT